MFKLAAAALLVWLAIALTPERTAPIEERVFLSQTCTDSKWFLEDSDDQSVTVGCYPSTAPSDPEAQMVTRTRKHAQSRP